MEGSRASKPGTPEVVRAALIPSAWSLAIHAGLLALVASVTWQVASPRRAPIEAALFDDPGAIEPADTLGAMPSADSVRASARTDYAPIEPVREPASGAAGAVRARELIGETVPSTLVRASLIEPAPSGVRYATVRAERAARVVFLVDASGAMTTSLTFVLEELERSVARLAPSQRFGVVIFREKPAGQQGALAPFEAFRIGDSTMHAPTPAIRRTLSQWLASLRPEGRSTPMEGLRAALDLRPDVVFLLARSIPRSGAEPAWGPGIDAILAELDRLNPADGRTSLRRAAIKAIQFIDDDPTGTMQAIARTHGNGPDSYRVLTIEALGRGAIDAEAHEAPGIPPALARADALLAEIAGRGLDTRAMFGVLLAEEWQEVRMRAGEAVELLLHAPAGEGYAVAHALLLARARLIIALGDWRRVDHDALAEVRAALEAIEAPTPRALAQRAGMIAIAARSNPDGLARLADARTALLAWAEFANAEDDGERSAIKLEIDLASMSLRTTRDAELLAGELRSSGDASRVLVATALARAMLARGELPERAMRPILDLAESDAVAPDLADRSSIVRALLAEVVDASWPPEALPREAQLAIASKVEQGDPERAARVLLLAHDADPRASEAPGLLWRAAALLDRGAGEQGSLDVARVLTRIVLEHPDSVHFTDAVEGAVARLAPPALEGGMGTQDSRAGRQGDVASSSQPDREGEVGSLLLAVLDAAMRAPAFAGRTDFALLRIELLLAGSDPAQLMSAIESLRALRPGPDASSHAERVLWLASRACASPGLSEVDRATLWATTTSAWSPDRAGRAHYELARARRAAGDSTGALDAMRTAMRDERLARTAEARLLLAECLIGIDDPAGAMSTLRALAPALDPRAADPDAREAYWRCWTLMLEILSREPTQARRDAIAAHAERLRSIDPDLGGEPWRSRIVAALRP